MHDLCSILLLATTHKRLLLRAVPEPLSDPQWGPQQSSFCGRSIGDILHCLRQVEVDIKKLAIQS